VEWLTGSVDVFHGTNFVLPPLRRAGGVVTVHDLAYLRFAHTVSGDAALYRELVPRALSRAARVVAVSRAVAGELVDEYGLAPDAVAVAPNGVDPAWAAATGPDAATRARLGLSDRYVLFVGNQEPRKNLGLLVRAHAAARSSDTSVPPLVIVGPAGWGDAWAGHPPDPRHVVLTGYLAEQDLHAVVAGAAAVCMPSLYEGFGLPVLEAMAAGRRVLASDIAALREIAGGHAQLLPVDDVDAWAHALVGLGGAGDDADAGHDATARRAHALAFTWRRSADAHLGAYRDAADEVGRTGGRSP
jgi:glycosyltransferase involved in cell wall biosynthesis